MKLSQLTLVATLLIPVAATAEPTDMVLLPRPLVEALSSWMDHPDATTAVPIYRALEACKRSNAPHPALPDDCPAVTQALRAQREALEKTAHPASAEPPHPASPPAAAPPVPEPAK